ncbi:MAG: DUF3313 domain-containing protein [Parvularcula sp.]|jgi:hypothetical protein|nr:DUF3313 domain-containing protein [Parvularcula sp.]
MELRNLAICAILASSISGPASAQAPTGLEAAPKLEEDVGKHNSWTYRNPDAKLEKYKSFIIEPTEVNSDPTASWGNTTAEKRQKYAAMLTDALKREIGDAYTIASKPGPGVAVMRLTLLGVESTMPGVATASRATPMGLALNGVKSIAGKPGSFTGSVQVAFELFDSRSMQLQFAAVRRRSPDALDIPATISTDATAQAVAKDVAVSIRKGLDKVHGR